MAPEKIEAEKQVVRKPGEVSQIWNDTHLFYSTVQKWPFWVEEAIAKRHLTFY